MELRELVNIEYPGIVENVDKMMETIGGMKSFERANSQPLSRLELMFRPKAIHAHSVLADRLNTHNLLVKCIKRTSTDSDGNAEVSYETKIVGLVETTFKFTGLADFQYLPMERIYNNSELRYKNIINDIIPNSIYDSLRTFNKNSPLFILPAVFSRFDSPSDYSFRNEPKHRDAILMKQAELQKDSPVIRMTRKSRSIQAFLLNWDEPIPEKPNPRVFHAIKSITNGEELQRECKKLFDMRPIWSRAAILYRLKCYKSELRLLLPTVAFYYNSGPFRCLWVRFGYNPKVNKASKIYQTLDFRIRGTRTEPNEKISAKRSVFRGSLPSKKREMDLKDDQTGSLIDRSTFQPSCSTKDEKSEEEKLRASVIFKVGLMPSCRQLFYQLCDIQVPEIQKLVHSNDGKEPEVCDDKDGWCAPGVIEKIRSMMNRIVFETLGEKGQATELPIYSSDEADLSEYDDEYLDYLK